MKQIILLLVVCFTVSLTKAQDVYLSSGGHAGYHKKAKKKGYDPAKLILGGGINAAFGSGATEVGISPIIGYRFFDKFSAGVGVGYQYYRVATYLDQHNNWQYENDNIIYPNLWARYFIYRNIFATASYEYHFVTMNNYVDVYGNQINSSTYTVQCMLFGFGFKQSLGGRVSGVMELMYDLLQQPNSPYYGQPVFRIGFCAGL